MCRELLDVAVHGELSCGKASDAKKYGQVIESIKAGLRVLCGARKQGAALSDLVKGKLNGAIVGKKKDEAH